MDKLKECESVLGATKTCPELDTKIYIACIMPIRTELNPIVGNAWVFPQFLNLQPRIDVKYKHQMTILRGVLTTLKINGCKKLRPFMLANIYKSLVLLDIFENFEVFEPVANMYEKFLNNLIEPQKNFMRVLRQRFTLLEFYILLDELKCNAILYTCHDKFAFYAPNSMKESCLIMRWENNYDLTYMGVCRGVEHVFGLDYSNMLSINWLNSTSFSKSCSS